MSFVKLLTISIGISAFTVLSEIKGCINFVHSKYSSDLKSWHDLLFRFPN